MKTLRILAVLCFIISLAQINTVQAQDAQKPIRDYTREEVLNIPYDKLIELPLEDLLMLADIMGVSLDELYELILNKDLVSASKSKESSFEAPLSTSVVSYDEIMASGARTLEEALRLVPGVIVREKTNGNFDIHIRGNDNLPANNMFIYSENSITLVMINSRPVYNYVHGGTFWETLPIGVEDIERIEVVRGPSSALYGPNAVSGVINFITKEAESQKLQVNAHGQAGMQNTMDFGLNVGQKVNSKFGYNVTANYIHGNRSTDLLYSVKTGKMMNIEQLDTSKYQGYLIYDPADSVAGMFPDPGLARETFGTNLYLFYDHNKNIGADVSAGYQYSDIISSSMGDNATSMVGRVSSTQYADARFHAWDLKLQSNIMNGWQDILHEDTGFKVEVLTINNNLEYDVKFDKFTIRPGLSHQYSAYNDLKFLKPGQGFLNGKRDFSVLAASIRIDARPIDPLRLIAAFRAEKYNTHDDLYFSYQFIGSYNIHDKHLVRGVVSRANRSPFLVDTYADYEWDREGRSSPAFIYFDGTKNLKLLTMDQYEFGYRVKPNRAIQLDLEAFYTHAKDFGGLYPENVTGTNMTNIYATMKFKNIPLTSDQYGLSSAITYIISKDFFVKLFGTYQKTFLTDSYRDKQEVILGNMIAFHLLNRETTVYTEDIENEATPSFYGGLICDYKLMNEKLKLNLNTYFMTPQVYKNKYNVFLEDGTTQDGYELNTQVNVNFKISYQVISGLDVYVNARNLLSGDKEFAFMDDIKPVILGGLQYNF
jgi:iron complex outermembrane recepter protein